MPTRGASAKPEDAYVFETTALQADYSFKDL